MAKKRSLILAGGGLKVGFQAGVLQVWMDEAGLEFDHADGASGGCFNLAMYCQGMSGLEIADNWRNLDPFLPVDLNWQHYWKLSHAPSLFSYDRFREKVLPSWRIDFDKIRNGKRLGTFNVFNFSEKRLEVVENKEMTEDFLIASVSLPMWFPPVRINGSTYIDSVFISDANVEEAIQRGADEIWAIWTVSTRDEWHDGFIAQYFQIVETTAVTQFFSIWNRLKENNRMIATGGEGEFGRHIELKLLQAEVPVHYLFNFSRDRMAESVNLGVEFARDWCRRQGVELKPQVEPSPTHVHDALTRLSFTEEMKGFVTAGAGDFREAYLRGEKEDNFFKFHLTISIEGVNRFVTQPRHEASAEGWLEGRSIGGQCPVQRGSFNLLSFRQDPAHREMIYRLYFENADGEPLTLWGRKEVYDDPGMDLWSDTTELFVRILKGHVEAGQEEEAEVLYSGVLRIYLQDFLKQLTTFRVDGPSTHDRVAALNRFGRFFFRKLWDVYARHFVEYGPW